MLYAVAVTALFVCSHRRYRAENRRLVQNQTALAAEVAHYRTQAGQEAASAQVLRLRCGEFEALRARPMPKRSAGWGSKSAGWRPPQRP